MKKLLFVLVLFMGVSKLLGDEMICLNSIGFLPDAPKKAAITSACTEFKIISANGEAIFEGTTSGPIHQDDVDQDVWIADFSKVKQTGAFYLDVPGVGRSVEFKIANNVYNVPFYASMRAMYLWRCGSAVKGEHI